MFIAFVAPVPYGHRSIFPLLVDGHLVISMRFAFRAVGPHFLWGFHTDPPGFATSPSVVYLLLAALRPRFLNGPREISYLNWFRRTLLEQCTSILCW